MNIFFIASAVFLLVSFFLSATFIFFVSLHAAINNLETWSGAIFPGVIWVFLVILGLDILKVFGVV